MSISNEIVKRKQCYCVSLFKSLKSKVFSDLQGNHTHSIDILRSLACLTEAKNHYFRLITELA